MRLLCSILLFSFLPIFTCFAQHSEYNVDTVLASYLPNKEKVDSLYNIGFEFYHEDYSYFKWIADSILQLAEGAGYNVGKGKAYILLALISEGNGELSAQDKYANQAVEIFTKLPPSKELSLALFSKGSYFRRKKRDKEATETFLQCLKVAEELGDQRMEATAYTSLGIMNVSRGNYDEALAYYDKVLDISLATGNKGRLQRTYTNIGIVYMRQKKFGASIEAHTKALSLVKELGIERDEAFVYNDLGAVYLNSGLNLSEAINYLRKSIEIRERINEKSELSYTYNYLGQAFAKSGNKVEAEKWIKKALTIAKDIGNDKQQYEALEELAGLNSRFNQYDSAYYYLRTHNELRDSIRQVEQSEAIAELTIQYETQKKEQEIALLTQQNTIQQLDIRQRNLYLAIAVLLLAGVSFSAWLIYRTRKLKEEKLKNEAILQAELLKLEAQNALQNDRLRISRDLHDNIGANLTFIHSAVAEANTDSNLQQSQWQDVQEMLHNTIGELRRTVWLINKPSVSFEEWVVKLREYYKKVSRVIIQYNQAFGDKQLTSEEATILFRITQEAVNNSLKYANADHIKIVLHADDFGIAMNITDNGRGFDIRNIAKGFGLDNIQQHAAELNASFTIESALGEGTDISVKTPW